MKYLNIYLNNGVFYIYNHFRRQPHYNCRGIYFLMPEANLTDFQSFINTRYQIC